VICHFSALFRLIHNIVEPFNNTYQPAAPVSPYEGFHEKEGDKNNKEDTRSILERSVSAAPVSPYEGFHEKEGDKNNKEGTRSILERSVSAARLVVDRINASISPTV
jgi:hypothetical protein